jgi:hypothetical protein
MPHRSLLTGLLAATCALFAACAGVPPATDTATAQAQPAEEEKTVCVREAPTASRMLQTRCYSLRSVQERARADREAADNIQTRPHDRLVGGS